MKSMTSAGVCLLSLSLTAACGGDRETGEVETRPEIVSETGCLTATGQQFVLTNLESGGGDASTETFQLIGKEDELRAHVGRQVRVTGEAEPAKVAVVEETTPPPARPEQPTGTGGTQPSVSSETRTRVEMRTLTVASVEAAGGSCAAETKRP